MSAQSELYIEDMNNALDDAWKDLEAAIGNVYHNEVFGKLQKAIQHVEGFSVPTPKILAFVYQTYADLAEETP